MTNLNQINRNIERNLIDLIKYPIITDKTTKFIEENQYCFAVKKEASKAKIKEAIEYIFNVRIKKVNTLNVKRKKRRVGKFIGQKTKYKKAIIKLHKSYSIDLFSEN
uniref:Large ribosomal subunit protein uL23c n=1 Tax=Rhodymenia pseudopalmata TaxID=31502 RepID=A0A1C9C7X3_RHOPU|nr:ribosomal protein L23 [Rhodymenia pseudopalmata]AOM64477.1 ribosomal protein L23 [Rhodymenia pseudopalmata]